MLLRVSCLLRSNHQATAKISGYNQRYRENRTKILGPVARGVFRIRMLRGASYLTGARIWWWSDPTRRSSWGSLLLVPVTIVFQLVPFQPRPQGFFLRKWGAGEPWRRALCPCRWTPIYMAAAGTKLEKHLSLTLLRKREFISQGLRNIRAIGFLRQWPFR